MVYVLSRPRAWKRDERVWKEKEKHRWSSTSSTSCGLILKISQMKNFKNGGKNMKSFGRRVYFRTMMRNELEAYIGYRILKKLAQSCKDFA